MKNKKRNAEQPKVENSGWYLEKFDKFDREAPPIQMTGLLDTEDDARNEAIKVKASMGESCMLYLVGPNNRRYPLS